MSYDFSLDRKRIILLISGLVLASVFLFAAGLMVGLAHSGTSTASQANNPNQMASLAEVANQPPASTSNGDAAAEQDSAPAGAPTAQPRSAVASPQPSPVADASGAAAAPPRRAATPVRKVTPQPARPRPHAAPAAAPTGRYYLQAGAFSSADHAIDLQTTLMKMGFAAQVVQARVKGRAWFIVRAGHYPTEATAMNAAQKMKSRLGIEPAIRH